jgi:hypothetical protein
MMSRRQAIRDAFAVKSGEIPDFERVFAAATRRQQRRRRRYSIGVSVTIAALSIVATIHGPASPGLVDQDMLFGTTQWRAPSDVLLPKHEIDIYSSVPSIGESTDTGGSAL